MGNLEKFNEPLKDFFVYRDKYGNMKATVSEKTAREYAKNGEYATVRLPKPERFTDSEEANLLKAFGRLECISGGDTIR